VFKLRMHTQIKGVFCDQCLTVSYLTTDISDVKCSSLKESLEDDMRLLCSSCDLADLEDECVLEFCVCVCGFVFIHSAFQDMVLELMWTNESI